MKLSRSFFFFTASMMGGVAFLFAWTRLSFFGPLSEQVWTFFSKIDGGRVPGQAADLELIFVFLVGALGTAALIFVFRCFAKNSR